MRHGSGIPRSGLSAPPTLPRARSLPTRSREPTPQRSTKPRTKPTGIASTDAGAP